MSYVEKSRKDVSKSIWKLLMDGLSQLECQIDAILAHVDVHCITIGV